MKLFAKPEILIFKVLRTSGLKEISTNSEIQYVRIKPDVRKTLNTRNHATF